MIVHTTSTYTRGLAFSNARASDSMVVCSGPLPTMMRLPETSARLAEEITAATEIVRKSARRNRFGTRPDR
jgi:hypothetical protein